MASEHPRIVLEDNKIKPADRPGHDWFRFVLSFPPHLVRNYIERFGISGNQRVLDPFCGTGTTLVECKKLGLPSVGIEANPTLQFISKTKTTWDVDYMGLAKHARDVGIYACQKLEDDGIPDGSDMPLFAGHIRNHLRLLSLEPEAMRLLLSDSISPIPLHKTLVLLNTLTKYRDDRYWDHERLALAQAMVFNISNLHFGPEVGVTPKKKRDASVVSVWLKAISKMVDDLHALRDKENVETTIHLGDARKIGAFVKGVSIDAVITSPPYPNEKDYTRTTRLESVLLGFIKSRDDLRTIKHNMIRSNTRGVFRLDRDDEYVQSNGRIGRIAKEIEDRRIELGKTSGFERLYSRVTKLYFGGMARHFAELRSVLKPGAYLAYVVGDQASYLRVMIRTGQLLAEIAQSQGYEVEGIDLFRTRPSTATKEQLREEVIVLRWPGTPRRTGRKK